MNETMVASVPAVMTKEKRSLFGYVSKQSNKSKESEQDRSRSSKSMSAIAKNEMRGTDSSAEQVARPSMGGLNSIMEESRQQSSYESDAERVYRVGLR
jgi:hypothetical protein